ncbi:hypothetical protein HNR77_006032 [Paenibacillus sp. JGP012]|nr:hypothetical protein [Paenibacillus sp. JGP012]
MLNFRSKPGSFPQACRGTLIPNRIETAKA